MWTRTAIVLIPRVTHSYKHRYKFTKFSRLFSARTIRAVQEDLLPDLIRTNVKDTNNWSQIRKAVTEAQVSSTVVDFVIMNYCCKVRNFDLGKTYLEFLEKENITPNLATIGKYFQLFYFKNLNEKDGKDENEILQLYSRLKKDYRVLDPITNEFIAQAISVTSHWKESLSIFNEIKISAVPNTETYSAVVAAAFRNSEYELGWTFLKEMIEKGRLPHDYVYCSYLSQIKHTGSKDVSRTRFEELFKFFKEQDIKCKEKEAAAITDVSKDVGFTTNTTDIDASGKCKSCNTKLKRLQLTPEEFKILKEQFFKSAIVGKNVFHRTHPKEIARFQNFLKGKRYDVVVDGLNVAYSAGVKQPPQVTSFLVASVVKHFVERRKKVLVVGRTHMQRWPKKNWDYIMKNAETFLVDSLSQDDPYLLYCALSSGNETAIVSKDLMRSHTFKMKEPYHKSLFRRWLLQNQHQLLYVNNSGKVFFKYPLPYMETAQNEDHLWHIPFEVEDIKPRKADVNTTPTIKWLCIKL